MKSRFIFATKRLLKSVGHKLTYMYFDFFPLLISRDRHSQLSHTNSPYWKIVIESKKNSTSYKHSTIGAYPSTLFKKTVDIDAYIFVLSHLKFVCLLNFCISSALFMFDFEQEKRNTKCKINISF